MLQLFDDPQDELFGPVAEQLPLPRLAVRRAWGTCPGCDMPALLAVGVPSLCALCGEAPARTAQHIALLRAATTRRLARTDHPGERAMLARHLERYDRADAALSALLPAL
jgi:hypothetical protein